MEETIKFDGTPDHVRVKVMATVEWGYLNHAIVEAAKALGGSFKLVTLEPKTVKEMTQLPRET